MLRMVHKHVMTYCIPFTIQTGGDTKRIERLTWRRKPANSQYGLAGKYSEIPASPDSTRSISILKHGLDKKPTKAVKVNQTPRYHKSIAD